MMDIALSTARGVQRVPQVRPRSQADRVSQARAPYLPPYACPPLWVVDAADEKTAVDPVDASTGFPVGKRASDAGEATSVDPVSPSASVSVASAVSVVWRVDDAEEQTAIDLVDAGTDLPRVRRSNDAGETTTVDPVEPDNEPTAVRPPIVPGVPPDSAPLAAAPTPPAEASRNTRFARGSSHGLGPSSLGHIGKYELREKLGRGAFGVVFTAHDPSLDRVIAIKVLRPTHLTNQEIVQRFLQEARATARIAHSGIVTIHDCGQVETNLGTTAFIAMELLTGESLTSRLAHQGRLAPEAATEIARQIASALEAAHHVDVLHRDLKPDNIHLVPDPAMPSGERVKILDFGLAKLGREGHTQLQTVFGTPRYMSPEQGRSATQIDHRSDIYSLGCILFELVTGRLPFEGDVRQLIECHQRAIPPRARSFAPDLPPALDDLIADMLAKDPMERPQTMGAVQRALHYLAGGGHASVAEGGSLAPADLLALTSGPQSAMTAFERPLPRRPSGPPEHHELPAPADAAAVSGEVLVPAVPRHAIAGAPPAPSAASSQPDRRTKLAGWGVVGLVALALALIALLTAV